MRRRNKFNEHFLYHCAMDPKCKTKQPCVMKILKNRYRHFFPLSSSQLVFFHASTDRCYVQNIFYCRVKTYNSLKSVHIFFYRPRFSWIRLGTIVSGDLKKKK